MNFTYKNAVKLSKYIILDKVKEGDTVVDATCGNGYDSELLSNLSGKYGKVYCFDIQKTAVENTRKRLQNNCQENNYVLINDNHENIDKYVTTGIKCAIFNLGYLPGSDHSIITRPESTIAALKKTLNLLLPGGTIIIVSYYGHKGGEEEKEAVLDFVKTIDCKDYTVIKADFINQVNCPPILVVIEKSYGHIL